jgi:hypothetical protein
MKRLLLLQALGALITGLVAQSAAAQSANWPNVDETTLAQMRGGFINSDGLEIQFSLENLVLINGEMAVQNVLEGNGGSFPMLTLPTDWTGTDGTFVNTSGTQTLIQNSLDNQTIQNFRILNMEIANAHHLGSLGLREQLDTALIQSLR